MIRGGGAAPLHHWSGHLHQAHHCLVYAVSFSSVTRSSSLHSPAPYHLCQTRAWASWSTRPSTKHMHRMKCQCLTKHSDKYSFSSNSCRTQQHSQWYSAGERYFVSNLYVTDTHHLYCSVNVDWINKNTKKICCTFVGKMYKSWLAKRVI